MVGLNFLHYESINFISIRLLLFREWGIVTNFTGIRHIITYKRIGLFDYPRIIKGFPDEGFKVC
jgi:hypothetical protein